MEMGEKSEQSEKEGKKEAEQPAFVSYPKRVEDEPRQLVVQRRGGAVIGKQQMMEWVVVAHHHSNESVAQIVARMDG